MDSDLTDVLRRTIGGDPHARELVWELADRRNEAMAVVMAAVLSEDGARLLDAEAMATSTQERQVVAIASAHVAGDRELVNALARDHLVDYPDSLIVAWLAGR